MVDQEDGAEQPQKTASAGQSSNVRQAGDQVRKSAENVAESAAEQLAATADRQKDALADRAEDAFMGEQRDRLRDSTADAVGKAAERAEEVGRSAVEKAARKGYPDSAGGDDETDAPNSANKSDKGSPAVAGATSSVSCS